MHAVWTITRRELRAFFDSPAAYIVLTVFLVLAGWFFASALFLDNVASLRSMFDVVPFLFLFFIPAVTMSTVAEERRSGTLELLLTMPVRDVHVVLGKLAAVVIFLTIAVGLTLVYALTLSLLGDLDFGATVGGYLGLFLLALSGGAIGILASSLTRNQIVAFVLGFGILFVLFLLDKVTAFVPGWSAGVVQYLGIDYHYQNLLRGVIDSRDVLYYLSLTAFSVLLTMYHLARRPE